MRNLYIQTANGSPVNHPADENNLIAVFGLIPVNWEPFVRVNRPNLTVYQTCLQEPVYEKVDSVWTDVWSLRDMTVQEKYAKQQVTKDAWVTQDQASNFTAWVFNELTCSFNSPISSPTTGYFNWSGTDSNWKEAPAYPENGRYKFDYAQWDWVVLGLPS